MSQYFYSTQSFSIYLSEKSPDFNAILGIKAVVKNNAINLLEKLVLCLLLLDSSQEWYKSLVNFCLAHLLTTPTNSSCVVFLYLKRRHAGGSRQLSVMLTLINTIMKIEGIAGCSWHAKTANYKCHPGYTGGGRMLSLARQLSVS